MREITREAELGPMLADKLFRVHLRNGKDVWLLIHVEVQSQPDPDFPQRMFVYYYRIRDRYNRDVVSVAIFGDESENWRPNEYASERFDCEIRFRYRTIKLLDWIGREDELLINPNPIALVMLSHLRSITTHKDSQRRKQAKSQLFRQLFERSWTEERIRQMFRIIDWFLELPKELEEQLNYEIHAYEEERHMPYVTSFERLAQERGRQEGRQEGQRQKLLEGVALLLETKFGEAETAFARELQTIAELDKLRVIQRAAVRSAQTIEELRAML